MKKFLLILILIPFLSFSQTNSEAMNKLQNSKELLEMGLISQKEFDSIANDLKAIILSSKVVEKDLEPDGFYIEEKRIIPEIGRAHV